MSEINILYILDNKLGGVTSLNYNLMKNAPRDFRQEVILIDNASDSAARPSIRFPVTNETLFDFDNRNNCHHNLRMLRRMVPDKTGAMVVNYGTEMAMLDHYPVEQTVFQLVHDYYNLKLAAEYGHVADVFISHNKDIYQKLQETLPSRQSDIFYLPHGVRIPEFWRQEAGNHSSLKLIFLGRLAGGKGIFDLPEISAILRGRGVNVEWTCIGAGPEEDEFRRAWDKEDRVDFISPASNEEVLAICAAHDVFVLPTKFEGSPVSLLETMSVGLVPVITDLPGGIRETVGRDLGFLCPIDDNLSFATAIALLHQDRNMLESMSRLCRRKIEAEFDVRETSLRYFSLFSDHANLRKQKTIRKGNVGSRLDKPWIPNGVTRLLRSTLK